MNLRRIRHLFLCASVLLAATGAFAQGLYYESVTKGGPIKEESESLSKTYLMPKMMKFVNVADQDFIVFRLDKEKVTSVDTKKKTYWEQTFAEVEKSMKEASGKMDEQMAQLQEQLKNMPEEQRKMMEEMLGKQLGSKSGSVTMSKTGESKKISGFSCMKYEAKEGDKALMTVWASKEVKGFAALQKDYEALSRRMTGMNPSFMKGLIDAMFKIEGFPIQTDWGGITTTVTKIEQRATPESEFTVPAGYTKVAAPALGTEGNEKE